jgi:preprotein translocase subunit SecB
MADQSNATPQGDGNNQGNNVAAAEAAPQQAQFAIERIYVKDLSLENPGAPQSFQMTESPQIEINLRTHAEQIGPEQYEAVLTLTVTANSAGKKVFIVETSQAGIFLIRGVPAEQMQAVLAIHCPQVLFPYARETVADATMRAGFPPVHLAPINFEALFQQQAAQLQPGSAATN